MDKKCKILLLFLLVIMPGSFKLFAQELTQTIRGKVVDKFTSNPLPNASVAIQGSDPLIGVSTDLGGNFEIRNVPIGRVNLLATFLGYNNSNIKNIQVFPAKEVVLYHLYFKLSLKCAEVFFIVSN